MHSRKKDVHDDEEDTGNRLLSEDTMIRAEEDEETLQRQSSQESDKGLDQEYKKELHFSFSDDEDDGSLRRESISSSLFHVESSDSLQNLEDSIELETLTQDPREFINWWPKFLSKTKKRFRNTKDILLADHLGGGDFVISASGFKWKRVSTGRDNDFRASLPPREERRIEVDDTEDNNDHDEDEPPSTFCSRMLDKLPMHWHFATLYLMLLGLCTSVIGACIDIIIYYCTNVRFWLLTITDVLFFQWLLWLSFTLVFVLLSLFITQKFSLTAAGSGIPEMKTILSGIPLPASLSARTLIVKVIALSLSMSSGMSIGKVGPFVHIGGLVANQLAKIPLFYKIQKNTPIMQQMFGAGAAVGYATSLGAPLGGVMLSVEVTSTYYPVRNYWFAYVSVISGAVGFRYLRNMFLANPGLAPLVNTSYFSKALVLIGMVELVIFVVLGVVAGLLGVLMIRFYTISVKTYRNLAKKHKWFRSPYVYASLVVLATSILTFPGFIGDFMGLPGFWGLQDCLIDNMKDNAHLIAKDWTRYPLIFSLLMSFLSRFLLTTLSIIIPYPAGLFAPILAAGGALGRVFGEVATYVLDNSSWLYEGEYIVPGGYAIVGAAAFAAGVTHTLSSAIIILEITGQIDFLMPVLISVTTAAAIAKKFSSLSIYDSMTKLKGLPYLPDVQQLSYELVTRDFMNTRIKWITKDFKYETMIRLLADKDEVSFPVVDSEENRLLIGTIDRPTLEKALHKHFQQLRKRQHSMARKEHKLKELADGDTHLLFQSAPIQLSETTPFVQVHMLFITLRLIQAYVTVNGRLVGRVTRNDLKQVLAKKDLEVTVLHE